MNYYLMKERIEELKKIPYDKRTVEQEAELGDLLSKYYLHLERITQ